MGTRDKIIIITILVVGAYGVGRYTAPEKIKIETKIVEVTKEVKTEKKNDTKKKRKVYKKTVEKKADGSSTTTTTIDENDSSTSKDDTTSATDTSISKEEKKDVTKASARTNLSFLAGVNPFNPSNGMVYGGSVTKDILGPINIGAFGLTSGVIGVSIGIGL